MDDKTYAVKEKKREVAQLKQQLDLARTQIWMQNATASSLFEKIADAEDWLFRYEPRTAEMKFDFFPEEPPMGDYDPDGTPAERHFEEDGKLIGEEREKELAQMLGYEDAFKMWEALGLFLQKDAQRKDGTVYEVSFNGDGTAKIREKHED